MPSYEYIRVPNVRKLHDRFCCLMTDHERLAPALDGASLASPWGGSYKEWKEWQELDCGCGSASAVHARQKTDSCLITPKWGSCMEAYFVRVGQIAGSRGRSASIEAPRLPRFGLGKCVLRSRAPLNNAGADETYTRQFLHHTQALCDVCTLASTISHCIHLYAILQLCINMLKELVAVHPWSRASNIASTFTADAYQSNMWATTTTSLVVFSMVSNNQAVLLDSYAFPFPFPVTFPDPPPKCSTTSHNAIMFAI